MDPLVDGQASLSYRRSRSSDGTLTTTSTKGVPSGRQRDTLVLDAELRFGLRQAISDARRATVNYKTIEVQAAKERERYWILDYTGSGELERLMSRLSPRARVDLYRGPLSRRQYECLEQYAAGHHIAEIARRLAVGAGVVATKLDAACERLGVDTRAEAVAVARRLGLL